jgi:dimethylargininase
MRALVRPPSPRLAEGLVTHIDRQPLDVDLARRQWDGYVAALQSAGWETVAVPAAPEHPDSVFVEDALVWWRGDVVVTRPGAPERQGETAGAEAAAATLAQRVLRIEGPDTLEGGDVLKIGERFFVGVGGRSTEGACRQLASLLQVEVVPVPVTKVLHLKSAVTALPDGTAIGYLPLVDHPEVYDEFLPVPEPGAEVVVLDEESVLMATSAPRTRALLQERGLRVVAVDISEFEKLEGCVTCLSVRLR